MLQRNASSDILISRQPESGRNDSNLLIAALKLRRRFAFDIVHAWDIRALNIAALAGSSPVIFTPSTFGSAGELKWLSTLMRFRNVHVVCSTDAQLKLLGRCGISSDRCRMIEPAFELDAAGANSNERLRQELGFSKDDFVLLAPGESTRSARHRLALWAISILHVFDPRFRLLLWGRGDEIDSLQRLARKLRQPKVLVCAEEVLNQQVSFQEVASVADMVLATAQATAAPLPLMVCMASGKPIVGSEDGLAGSMLRDGQSAALSGRGTSRLLAQRVLELVNDPAWQRSLSNGARQAAAAYSSIPQFVNAYFEMYRELAGGSARDRQHARYLAAP
jgi:glycosyltransferase involved in cell wall biosynthesis